MTTTLINRSLSGRTRTGVDLRATATGPVCPMIHAPVPASIAGASPAVPTTTEMNLWLGGDVQGSGFDPKYATKRIAPGRLEGMT